MMNLETMRLVVTTNMPYDTGFMFMAGAKFFETGHYLLCKYDIERVPYIVYNEEGTIYTQVNKGFIKDQTVGDLLRHASYGDNQAPILKLEKQAKRRASANLISQGVVDKLKVR